MASDTTMTRLRTLYPKLSKMPSEHLHCYLSSLARKLENRSYGNYNSHAIDNLSYMEDRTCDDAVMVFRGTDPLRNIWHAKYWPFIRQLHFRFYRVQDFVDFRLPWAKKHPTNPCVFYLIGPNDEPDFLGQHQHCRVVDQKIRGCDICELLFFLSLQHGSGNLKMQLKDRSLQEHDGKAFDFVAWGTVLRVTGRWDGEKNAVTGLIVEGLLGSLPWNLWRPLRTTQPDDEHSGESAESEHESTQDSDNLLHGFECDGPTAQKNVQVSCEVVVAENQSSVAAMVLGEAAKPKTSDSTFDPTANSLI